MVQHLPVVCMVTMMVDPTGVLVKLVIFNSFWLTLNLWNHLVFAQIPGGLPNINLNKDIDLNIAKPGEKDGKRILGPCQVCREVVRSFERGMRDTVRGKYEGGNTEWEDTKLKSYKDSELRLTEIQEKLCTDLKNSQDQCHELANQHESLIEHWWFNERKQGKSLHDHLCIDQLKVCCPGSTYGPECKPCPGFPGEICNGHGSCKGNGTRKGSGKCQCYAPYRGEFCESCATGYFVVSEKDGVQECEQCDKSCLGQCRGKGQKGCHVCKDGYIWDSDYGCLDIDECHDSPKNPCPHRTFCVNTEGSYHCFECDKSCDGCHGDGPDSCTKCAPEFSMKDGVCIDTVIRDREASLETSRYATYVGLCFATCIIFRKNIYIASGIGILVAMYIGAAEFTVRDITGAPHPLEKVASRLFG